MTPVLNLRRSLFLYTSHWYQKIYILSKRYIMEVGLSLRLRGIQWARKNIQNSDYDIISVPINDCIFFQRKFFRQIWFSFFYFYFDVLGNSSYESATEWTKAMKNCKDGDQPSYLLGNVELQNAYLSCNSIDITNKIALFWIGVARQKYLNKDDGELIFIQFYITFHWVCKNHNYTFK